MDRDLKESGNNIFQRTAFVLSVSSKYSKADLHLCSPYAVVKGLQNTAALTELVFTLLGIVND